MKKGAARPLGTLAAAVVGSLLALGSAAAMTSPAGSARLAGLFGKRPAPAAAPDPIAGHNFYFARAEYTGDGMFPQYKDWETDFPKADYQFLSVFKRLASVDAYDNGFPVRLDDPELRRLPYLYAVEVGHMSLTPPEVEGLRDYLLAGGFLVVDDFWGTAEWNSFARQMAMVFPDREIVDLPLDHPLFHAYYDIDEIVQVPNSGQAAAGGPTWESDGYMPAVRGIMDDDGRLMVAINWNTDLGDGWEWAELAEYPLRYSSYAFQIGANTIVYALSH